MIQNIVPLPHFIFFTNTNYYDKKNLSACDTATLLANDTIIGNKTKGNKKTNPLFAPSFHIRTSSTIYTR